MHVHITADTFHWEPARPTAHLVAVWPSSSATVKAKSKLPGTNWCD
jgi:hypothetical protein